MMMSFNGRVQKQPLERLCFGAVRKTSTLLLSLLVLFSCLSVSTAQTRCGCNQCTSQVLQSSVGDGETCEARIDAEMNKQDDPLEELDACRVVAQRYPAEECGPYCHPDKCDGRAPAHCNCLDCTVDVWNTIAGGSIFSCGDLMKLGVDNFGETEIEACARVSERYEDCAACDPDNCPTPFTAATQPPTAAPAAAAPTEEPNNTAQNTSEPIDALPEYCGCFECSDHWDRDANLFTCGDRILYYTSPAGGNFTVNDACRRVSVEYPYICGPGCHPEKCDGRGPDFCGCAECTLEMLGEDAGGFTCAQRIASLRLPSGGNLTEEAACERITSQYSSCSATCNPKACGRELQGTKADQKREGAPWAWAVLGANALFCVIIFILYRKW